MSFTLKIETDNAAFDDDQGYEVARLLVQLANHLDLDDGGQGGDSGTLRDLNGNTVGAWTLDPRNEAP